MRVCVCVRVTVYRHLGPRPASVLLRRPSRTHIHCPRAQHTHRAPRLCVRVCAYACVCASEQSDDHRRAAAAVLSLPASLVNVFVFCVRPRVRDPGRTYKFLVFLFLRSSYPPSRIFFPPIILIPYLYVRIFGFFFFVCIRQTISRTYHTSRSGRQKRGVPTVSPRGRFSPPAVKHSPATDHPACARDISFRTRSPRGRCASVGGRPTHAGGPKQIARARARVSVRAKRRSATAAACRLDRTRVTADHGITTRHSEIALPGKCSRFSRTF